MELKKGMYVRDGYEGIGQVEDICTCEQCKERGFYEPIISYANHTEYVTSYNNMQLYEGKVSDNLVKLIQVGDYVNGHRVLGVYNFRVEVESDAIENETWEEIESHEIKSIVTKEQFSQMAFKVGE